MTLTRALGATTALLLFTPGCDAPLDAADAWETDSYRQLHVDDEGSSWRATSTWLSDGTLILELEEVESEDVTRFNLVTYTYTFSASGWMSVDAEDTDASLSTFRSDRGSFLVDGDFARGASAAVDLALDNALVDQLSSRNVSLARRLVMAETVSGDAARGYNQFLDTLSGTL